MGSARRKKKITRSGKERSTEKTKRKEEKATRAPRAGRLGSSFLASGNDRLINVEKDENSI